MTIDEVRAIKDRIQGALRTQRAKDMVETVWLGLLKMHARHVAIYSVTTVRRFAEEINAATTPALSTMNNKGGAHYRELIQAFAKAAGARAKKRLERQTNIDRLIESIENIEIRTQMRLLRAQAVKAERDVNEFRRLASMSYIPSPSTSSSVPSVNERSIEADSGKVALEIKKPAGSRPFDSSVGINDIRLLEGCLNEARLQQRRLTITADGAIMDLDTDYDVLPPGFAKALRRIIDYAKSQASLNNT